MPAKKKLSAPPERVEIPAEAVTALLTARENIARWEKVQADARAVIEAAMGDSPVGTLNGAEVVVWRQEQKRKQFNRKAFSAAYPDIEAEFIELVPGNRPFKPVAAIIADDED